MSTQVKDCHVVKLDVPGIAQKRPADMAAITAEFELSEMGRWLVESNVPYDLAMSGMDFIGEVYLLIFDRNEFMRFKLTFL